MRDYGPDLFAGTAEYYAKYRPAYPARMFDDIKNFFGLDGRGDLLDLGCGTGEITVPLAPAFHKALGLDPEPEMLAQAKLRAKASGADNIDWRIGSSKTLTGVKSLFRLITLGQSLHWMNERKTLDQLYGLLEPEGGLFIVSGGGISVMSAKKGSANLKELAIKRLITKYLGAGRRAGQGLYKPSRLSWEHELFPSSKFGGFEKRVYTRTIVRDIDQELGNLYSMSWARRDYFGADADHFEAEFRRDLKAISKSGKFRNQVLFEAYFLRK